MRRLPLLIFCILFFSCGKKTLPSSQVNIKHPQADEYATTINETDLLDVAIDVSIEISLNKIYFKQSESQIAEGKHSDCALSVLADESYDYKYDGDLLEIRSKQGILRKFLRLSGEPNSLIGIWTNKTIEGSKMILSRMTFVSEERMIIRNHCES
jgi:hypothetical protein